MELPPEKVKELQEIYRRNYGEEISVAEAQELGEYLVGLLRVVYQV